VKFCRNAPDGDSLNAERSTDVTSGLVTKTAADDSTVPLYASVLRPSRKSLSLDNLQTVDDSLMMDVADDDLGPQSQSAMYARNMNQSFRVAVDKSFEGPTLGISSAG